MLAVFQVFHLFHPFPGNTFVLLYNKAVFCAKVFLSLLKVESFQSINKQTSGEVEMKISRTTVSNLFKALLLVSLGFPFAQYPQTKNTSPQTENRVNDLLDRMTLEEKISLLSGTGFDTVEIKAAGNPALRMTDGPAGVRSGQASSFPSPIALAATFDPQLVYEVSKAIAQEAKAKGKNVLLAPCVNIQRTPLAAETSKALARTRISPRGWLSDTLTAFSRRTLSLRSSILRRTIRNRNG
jgi:hypothetical protein